MEFDKTMSFQVEREENSKCQEILKEVYEALVEKGYNPINQIVGYIYQVTQHILQVIKMQEINKNYRKRRTIRKNG